MNSYFYILKALIEGCLLKTDCKLKYQYFKIELVHVTI